MKMLNLNDNLSIVDIADEDVRTLTINIDRSFLKNNLYEIDENIKEQLHDLLDSDMNINIDIYAAKIATKPSIQLFYTIISKVVGLTSTAEAKFDEKHLSARDEVLDATTIPTAYLNKLLNYKNKKENLQINLYRNNKKILSMVE